MSEIVEVVAQTTTESVVDEVKKSTAETVTGFMQNNIDQYLAPFAAKFGVAVEHLYAVLVKQMAVYGVAYIIGGLIGMALCGWLCVFGYKKSSQADSYDDWEILGGLLCFVAGVGFIGMIFLALNGMMHVLNPEYFALEKIMFWVKGSM